MANGIIAGTSTISGGVVTFTFVVAPGGAPVFNYDIQITFDPAKATFLEYTGIPNALAESNVEDNVLSLSTARTTAVASGGVVGTVSFQLTNPSDTSLAVSFTGLFNDPGVALTPTPLSLGNGTISSPLQGVPTITAVGGGAAVFAEDQVLVANGASLSDGDGTASITYQWLRDGAVAGTGTQYTLGDADVGKKITLRAVHTDSRGDVETKDSAQSAAVQGVNDTPTGGVAITGNNAKGATLTSTQDIADVDGLGTLNYQWYADNVAIATNGTGTSYTLTADDVGKDIKLVVTYTDLQGFPNTVTSNVIEDVVADHVSAGQFGFPPGIVFEDQRIDLFDQVADVDGIASKVYKWYRADDQAGTNKVLIEGASSSSYRMTQADVGKFVSATVTVTDSLGNVKTIDSNQLMEAVKNVNDTPTGAVTIANTTRPGQGPQQGDTLSAANTLADEDGLGEINYHWFLDDDATAFSSGATLTLTQAEVGHKITVKVVYTDQQGKEEVVPSTQTASVANVNDPATGTVTVTGLYKQNEILTVSSSLADVDGLGTVQYHWFMRTGTDAGTEVEIGTGNALTLTQAHVGKVVYAKAVFTDQQGHVETVSSVPPGDAVGNVNDAPAGNLALKGVLSVGAVLGTTGQIDDLDGMGAVTYEWQVSADGTTGWETVHTGATFALTTDQLGKHVRLHATYTDGFDFNETVDKVFTGTVQPNAAPQGAVVITGTVKQGETLTVSNTITDADGIATDVTYAWYSGSSETPFATGTSAVLTQAQVGKPITVVASYTDSLEKPETVSATTANVENVDDALQGSIAIDGTAAQNQALAANTAGLSDADGALSFAYEWTAGTTVVGTGSTLHLGQNEVNKTISLKVTTTDALGGTGTRTVTMSSAVANVNDAATGAPVIVGLPEQGAQLTVDVGPIGDADGKPTSGFTYQWFAGGTAINGATGATYTLTQAEVGKAVTVQVKFTDLLGGSETVVSAATAAVENVDDNPTGIATLDGAMVAGMPLTVNTSRLFDLDNLSTTNAKGAIPKTGEGSPTYKWYVVDGQTELLIEGQSGSTFTPDDTHKDKRIKVVGTFTDAYGGVEEFTATTAKVIFSEGDVKSATGVAGDGNGDGIADSAQAAVVSTPFTVTGTNAPPEPVFVTLVADSNDEGTVNDDSTAVITTINQQSTETAAQDLSKPPPSKMDTPLGVIDFTATTTKATETFTLFVSANVEINGYWKLDPATNTWVNLASAPFGGSLTKVGTGADAKWKIVFQIEDNGRFDADDAAGIIRDPGCLATLPLSVVGYSPDVALTADTHFFF